MENEDMSFVQEAVQASFGLFVQNQDLARLAIDIHDFGKKYSAAFDDVADQKHSKLMRQCEALYDFIKIDCMTQTDQDVFYNMLDAYLNSIPVNADQVIKISSDIEVSIYFDPKPEMVDLAFASLSKNLIKFGLLERLLLISRRDYQSRNYDDPVFSIREPEKKLENLFYWLADLDDQHLFSSIGSPLLEHAFENIPFDNLCCVHAIAIDVCRRQEKIRVSQRSAEYPISPMVLWMGENQYRVAKSVLSGSWSSKFHGNYIDDFRKLFPELLDISNAMVLRSHDPSWDALYCLKRDFGVTPDQECIDIMNGRYNSTAYAPTNGGLGSLIMYSLAYGEDIVGDSWNTPKGGTSVECLSNVTQGLRRLGGEPDQQVLDRLAPIALSHLQEGDALGWIEDSSLFRPYLNASKKYQGLRLQQDLGM
ncbi:hypothetical protein [Pseudomonas putida]|uniref:Uncharacterized protein n=1 Tax=Pseudomonas putida TaxID=303 RepID=A0A8I1EBR3_PSEPU|nr:hypothetical protein [Pseudomonas putida]MBI6882437.1 hypothetical protein [Pseudomonas putida]